MNDKHHLADYFSGLGQSSEEYAQRRRELHKNAPLETFKRVTFDGKIIDVTMMKHSHVSNSYWYSKIIKDDQFDLWERVIAEKFDNVILPYQPHPDFKNEFNFLMENGYLISTSYGYDVLFSKIKIGEIRLL